MLSKSCSCKDHIYYGSIYDKDKVPINDFLKPKSSDLYKMCINCRNHLRITQKTGKIVRYNSENDKYKESVKIDGEFFYCPRNDHPSKSLYPRDKVPKCLFRKEQNNVKSIYLNACLDCRNNRAQKSLDDRKKLQELSKSNNIFRCSRCKKEFDDEDRAINLDGTKSASCKTCKKKVKEYSKNIQLYGQSIKHDLICKYQSCCYICNKIFIKNPIDNNIIFEIDTEMINDRRVLKYENVYYDVIDFINQNKNLIAYNILQFDHLPEEDQRNRGLLKDDDPYIPKKNCVNAVGGPAAMKLEAEKTQLVDARCHLLETIKRQSGKIKGKSKIHKLKSDYVNELKKAGCCLCNYKNDDLPRFFHFDHINPSLKITDISAIVMDKLYTFDDLLKEIEKCRLLCNFCHIIHTDNQRINGELPHLLQKY